ncbi:hypothetical protein JTB14_028886 [Gonioctena quinquepunctata]|nr:hypothetical protein JTB14_028886 [Gonioctena quinquepunctata]
MEYLMRPSRSFEEKGTCSKRETRKKEATKSAEDKENEKSTESKVVVLQSETIDNPKPGPSGITSRSKSKKKNHFAVGTDPDETDDEDKRVPTKR